MTLGDTFGRRTDSNPTVTLSVLPLPLPADHLLRFNFTPLSPVRFQNSSLFAGCRRPLG